MNENDSDVDDVVSVDNDMSADDVGDSTMEVDHVVPVDGAKKRTYHTNLVKLNKKIRSRSPYNEQIAVASDATRKVKQQQALYDVGFSIENTNKALRLCEGVSKADPNFQGEAFKMLSSAIDAIIRSPIDTTTVDAKQQAGKFCGELGDQVFHNDNLSTNK